MRSDIAGIVAALRSLPRIMVLGDDDRDWDLAWSLADALQDRVDLGVSHGGVAAGLAERRRAGPGASAVKVNISPHRGFWEADRFGTYDMLVLGGLEQRFDPLEILVYARTLDVRLLCVESGVLPSSLGAAAGVLADVGTIRVAGRSLPPTVRRVLVAQIDRVLRARARSAAQWHWFMTATGIRDLLLRAGWHVLGEFESAEGCGSFFLCGRESAEGSGDPVSAAGQGRTA